MSPRIVNYSDACPITTDRDREVVELREEIEALNGVKRLADVLERSKSLEEAFVRFKRLKDKEFDTN